MNDEKYLLASAYVDGEITDDERELAENDPAVMAEVAVIRAARSAIADVPPPSEGARRAAIAAAMVEFDRTVAPAAAASEDGSTAVTPMRAARQRRSMRWLQVAAVAAAVGLGGIVVSRSLGGDDDDAADVDTAAESATATDAFSRELAESAQPVDEPAEEPASEEAAVESASEGDSDAAEGGLEMAAEPESAADASADEATDAPAADASAGDDDGPVVEFADGGYAAQLDLSLAGRSNLTPITTPDELLAYARAVAEAATVERPEPDLPSGGDCAIDEPILADAYVDTGTGPTLALIGIDDRLLVTRAYDPETCQVLVEV